jgi:acylpyruvate hydrolase
MRFVRFDDRAGGGLAVVDLDGRAWGHHSASPGFPGTLEAALSAGDDALRQLAERCRQGKPIDLTSVRYLPPIARPEKIVCVGLNYADHTAESGYQPPSYPTLFARFPSSLIGHGDKMVRPAASEQLDFEGELAAVIGREGRHIPLEAALDHVVGYSIFNDGSVRDFQHRTPQWTAGKNFDGTGAFGPYLVTADELPRGCRGLHLETRLNGKVVQSAPTDDMIFDVATLVSLISAVCTLSAGDVIVTGTPSGVGAARKPPLWMAPGDVCEVGISNIGILRNTIVQEGDASAARPTALDR